MKKGEWKDNCVKCPHYLREARQRIVCKGVQEGSNIHITFSSISDLKDYKAGRCKGGWDKCPIACLLNEYDF